MADDSLHFVRIASAGEQAWRVLQSGPAGRLLGTVAEEGGGWKATALVAGKLRVRRFPDRDAAAAWLASVSGKARR